MNPVHRIEPQLLTEPQFYGSPGEPYLGTIPNVDGNTGMGPGWPAGPGLGPAAIGLPLGGLLGMLYSQRAQTPGLLGLERNPYDVKPGELGLLQMLKHGFKSAFSSDPAEADYMNRKMNEGDPQPQLQYEADKANYNTQQEIAAKKLSDNPNDEPLDIMPGQMRFDKAFAKARKMGLVQFTWRGKSYTTELRK